MKLLTVVLRDRAVTRTRICALLGAAVCISASAAFAAETPAAKATPPPAVAPAPLFADPVIAKGKNVQVKQSELEDSFRLLKANFAARGQDIPEGQRAEVEDSLLEKLIVSQLLTSRATSEDKTKAKDTAEKYIADAKKNAPSEEAFNRQLLSMGMSAELFRTQIAERAVCEEVLNRELRDKISISEVEVGKFFKDNEPKFGAPEQVRASHILISTKNPLSGEDLSETEKKEKLKFAEKLRDRARKGEDFAKLAKDFSDDPGSKDKGGEYTFPRGQMVREFENTAFGMKTNEVSDIVVTTYGYHIIKFHEKIPAQKPDLAKAEKNIRDYLTREEVQKQMPDFFEKLKKEADVQILDPKRKSPVDKK